MSPFANMRYPILVFLIIFTLVVTISAVPAANPDMELSIRPNADMEVYHNNDPYDPSLSPRAVSTSTSMLYYAVSPFGLAGAYYVSQNNWAAAVPFLSVVAIVALIQIIGGLTLFPKDLTANLAEGKARIIELEQFAHELDLRIKNAEVSYDQALQNMRAKTQETAIAAQAHAIAMAREAREARQFEQDQADRENSKWKRTFKDRLNDVERSVRMAQVGGEALQNATRQYNFAIDTTQEFEDRQAAQAKAATYLQKAKDEITKASAAWVALQNAVKSEANRVEDSTFKALREEMEKAFAVSTSAHTQSTRRTMRRSYAHAPRHLGQAGSTCDEEFCSQLWYTSSFSHPSRRSLEASKVAHDLFFIPPDYHFDDSRELVRRDQTIMFQADCMPEDYFGRLTLQEGDSVASALILMLTDMEEIEFNIESDAKNIPKVTEDGMTFSKLDRPGVHCLSIGIKNLGMAIRGVYTASNNTASIQGSMDSELSNCIKILG